MLTVPAATCEHDLEKIVSRGRMAHVQIDGRTTSWVKAAILERLPMLVLRLHGTEIERPLTIVMIGSGPGATSPVMVVVAVVLLSFTMELWLPHLGPE